MLYGTVSFEKRIKENIKNYKPVHLFPIELLEKYLKDVAAMSQIELLLTDRHGGKVITVGEFSEFHPDVVMNPGIKLRVLNRTVAHLYIKTGQEAVDETEKRNHLIESMMEMLSAWGEQSYLYKEHSIYDAEMAIIAKEQSIQRKCDEREDILTGVLNKSYFENRMKIIERSGVVPIAVINANINDWKFANDHFGDAQSDRLIQIVAHILKEEARTEYVIGRTDGDVFYILIPLAGDGEAEEYCKRAQGKCSMYEDPILAPSIAMGWVVRTNVEESLEQLMSDAEYEMFQNKLDMKQVVGYQVRLQKGT